MFRKKIKSKPWYSYTVAICAGVILFVFLTSFTDIWDGLQTFIGYFTPVIWGCVIAYLINPLSKFYGRTVFCGIKNGKAQLIVSNTVAFITVLLVLISALILLIPELVGRFPVLTHLEALDRDALRRILTEPKNALTKQYEELFRMDGITLVFDPKTLDMVVDRAVEYHLGARGLRSIMESIMTDLMYDLPQMEKGSTYTLTPEVAKEKMKL